MIEFVLPPAFVMIIGALLVGVARPAMRPLLLLATPLVTLYFIWQVGDGVQQTVTFLGYQVQLVDGSALRRLFATVFALMAFGGTLFAFRQSKWWELSAALLYAAGAIGVSFAGDLIVMFLFWELMALFSTVVVWCGGTESARAAGIRYAIIHLLGGIILKIGIEGLMIQTGSIEIRALTLEGFSTWMIFIGVLINAAAPPISVWLADAYPESSPMGGVFLSAFTTKTAVLSLILLFPGQPLLIWIGLFMIFYGIIYALLENDMRRILSYSIVNQVGFMVCGIGIGTELALN
ncbi:MAG: proton-conducting transporter membrane subunit, partial [Wenzhouxiangellaceae bacterium]|nr:proton-conducting transporter membrane subunit [Wenzhouxiangellaceae bacterium]